MVQGDADRPLIEQAQGELPYGTQAFDQLVAKHSGAVFRRAYSILRSHSDAEEASQDVFLAVFRNLPRYRFERPFAHWLSVVTLNSCRMILRRRAAEQRRRDAVAREPEPSRGSRPDSALDRDMVLRLLDHVEPGTRIALVMRFVEGFSYAEIGEQLDLSQSAVKMRVSRGAKRLRELYEQHMSENPGKESGDGSA